MNPSIIFVDDEPNVIDGLRRMLRPLRQRWDMAFATSGLEALRMMEQRPCDVIVSDMRMPGMDGCQLLEEVERRCPQIVRVVLSGSAGAPEALGSLRPTHQYLAKPCDADTVRNTIERALKLRELVPQEKVRQLISCTGSVPSLPSLYAEIMTELNSEDCSIGRVAGIIECDAGMTAKILQLANSAFFGLRGQVSTASDAIFRLGLDVVKALALSVQVFSAFQTGEVKRLKLTHVWPHSLSTAALARDIAVKQNAEASVVDIAFTAGLLHDMGKLILAANVPDEYHQALKRCADSGVKPWQGEYVAFGVTHAEIGAYLIGLWGLPDALVEAIAFHHGPSRSRATQFGPVAAVHAANALDHFRSRGPEHPGAPDFDTEYLSRIGLGGLAAEPQKILAEITRAKE
jgi:putative nucleotidyltransferase with HDIG domain